MAIFGNRQRTDSGGGGGRPSGGGGSVTSQPAQARRPNNNNNNNNRNRNRGGGGGGNHHPNRGPALPAQPAAAAATTNPYGDMLGTGPTGLAFNNVANAIQGGLGLLGNAGGQSDSPFQGQNDFMKNFMTGEYGNFENTRIANPGQDNYTWINHLRKRYAPGLTGANANQTLSQNMLNSVRRRYRRSDPSARGYFSNVWTGPARTITG